MSARGSTSRTSQPNVVLIMADQFSYRCLGVAGHPDVQTPRLDRLAREGVRCTHAFVQNPICTPSRMSWLTGVYPHNHGYYGLSGPNPAWLPHAFAHFRAHSYVTGAVGKLHTPYGWIEPALDYRREAYHYGNSFRSSDYGEYLRGAGLLADRDDDVLQEWAAIGGRGQGLDARPSRLAYKHCVDHWTAAHAADFLRARPQDRPFFLWVSIPRPHQVWAPSREFWDLYNEASLTLPPNAADPLADKPPHVRAMLRQRQNNQMWLFEPRDWEHSFRRALRGYLACVTQTDYAAGEVLDALDELGLAEDTIVVFGADHGGFAGDHGIVEKAPGVAYEAITRIPLIWRAPGRIAADHLCDALVESVDFVPTVCSLAGVPAPRMCDGRDISALLQGERQPVRDAAFTENPWTKRIRTARWSFVHFQPEMFPHASEDAGELYDLEADLWELRNLYGDRAYQDVVHDLRRRVLEWLIGTQHPMTLLPMPADLWREDSRGEVVSVPAQSLPEDGRIPPARIARHVREGGSRNYL